MKSRGGISVPSLKPGTRILVETATEAVYDLRLHDPRNGLMQIWSTDDVFKPFPPRMGYFIESWGNEDGLVRLPGWIVPGARMILRFIDAKFLSGPVVSARLEGDGWYYEAF